MDIILAASLGQNGVVALELERLPHPPVARQIGLLVLVHLVVGRGRRRGPNKSSNGQVGKREERRKETNSVLAQSHAKADLGNQPQDVNTCISS